MRSRLFADMLCGNDATDLLISRGVLARHAELLMYRGYFNGLGGLNGGGKVCELLNRESVFEAIACACKQGEAERAIELMLDAAEALHVAEPRVYPKLVDGVEACRCQMMRLALRMNLADYEQVTRVLGLGCGMSDA